MSGTGGPLPDEAGPDALPPPGERPPGILAPGPHPVAKFFGALIMALGALMTVLCGLCTVVLGIGTLTESSSGPDNFVSLPLVAMIGGIPTLIGIGVFLVGRAIYRASS